MPCHPHPHGNHEVFRIHYHVDFRTQASGSHQLVRLHIHLRVLAHRNGDLRDNSFVAEAVVIMLVLDAQEPSSQWWQRFRVKLMK